MKIEWKMNTTAKCFKASENQQIPGVQMCDIKNG